MSNSVISLLFCLILSGCFAGADEHTEPTVAERIPAAKEQNPNKSNKDRSGKIRAAADSFYTHDLIPAGFNGGMLVAKNGSIVFEAYHGKERIDKPDLMDSSSAIHLASVSKTFTAMAILKLAEEGKLSLNDEAALHLKGFPYPGVTIKNMLNHRSGLPNYVHFMEDPGTGMSRPVSNQDILQYMSRNKAKLSITRPDTHFSYSNTNYALLALIIEKVSGKTYAQYLKETLFRPLGMDNTFVFSTDKADYVIPSYDWRNRQIAFSFLDAVYGDKNIYSTPRDLLKWDQALYTDQLFRKETLDMAFAGYSFEKPGKRNYGLGWRLYEFPGGKKVIYHNGWWHGNNVVFSRLPQDSATIIVMGNKFTRRIYEARKIYTAFEGYGRADDGDE